MGNIMLPRVRMYLDLMLLFLMVAEAAVSLQDHLRIIRQRWGLSILVLSSRPMAFFLLTLSLITLAASSAILTHISRRRTTVKLISMLFSPLKLLKISKICSTVFQVQQPSAYTA